MREEPATAVIAAWEKQLAAAAQESSQQQQWYWGLLTTGASSQELATEADRGKRDAEELRKEVAKLRERCVKAEKREAELSLALKVEIDRRIQMQSV